MRYEFKHAQIKNDVEEINRELETDSAWGWEVVNLQVIDSKNTYRGNSYGWMINGTAVTISETVHERITYACLTYKRDVEEERYPVWRELEERYERLKAYASGKLQTIRERIAHQALVRKRICVWSLAMLPILLLFALITMENSQPIRLLSSFLPIWLILVILSLCSFRWFEKYLLKKDQEYQSFLHTLQNEIIPEMEKLVEKGLNT